MIENEKAAAFDALIAALRETIENIIHCQEMLGLEERHDLAVNSVLGIICRQTEAVLKRATTEAFK